MPNLLASGFDAPAFQNTNPARTAAASTVPKKKSFWGDQISSGGGIAGGLAGGAAGAAIGSFVPVIGTAIGGLVGGAIGAFGGGAAGQKIENKKYGTDDNIWREGAIQGLTSLPLGKIVKGGKVAVDALRAKQGVKAAVEAGGEAATQPGKSLLAKLSTNGEGKASLPGKLRTMSDKLLTNQYGVIPQPVTRSANPEETLRELASYGVVKPADVERLAGAITGGNGAITRAVSDAAGNAGRVDINNLRKVLTDAMDSHGIVDTDAKSLLKTFDAQMKPLMGGAGGSLDPGHAHPSDVLKMIRNLEKRAANLEGKSGNNYRRTTPERGDQAAVLKMVRDELEDRLYQGAGANANLPKVLTPAFREQLVALHPNNEQWAKFVDSRVMGAKGVDELRSAMAPFVRGSQIVDASSLNSMTFAGRNSGQGLNVKDHLLNAAAGVARNPVARAGSSLLTKTADRLSGTEAAAAPSLLGKLTKTSAKLGTVGAVRAGLDQPAPEEAAPPQADTNTPHDMPEGVDILNPNAPKKTDPHDNVDEAIQRALASGDTKGLNNLLAVAEYFDKRKASKNGDLSANQQKQLIGTQAAAGIVKQIEDTLNGLGSSGRIGGAVAKLEGKVGLNDNVSAYEQQRPSIALNLIKAIQGSAGSVSDTDRDAIMQSIPSVSDTPGERANKIASLNKIIATYAQAARSGGLSNEEPQ